jgi:hypothetical protein
VLQFSLRYAELVLNGRINHRALTQLIIRILMHVSHTRLASRYVVCASMLPIS